MYALDPRILETKTKIITDKKTNEPVADVTITANEDEFAFAYHRMPRLFAKWVQTAAKNYELIGFMYDEVRDPRELCLILRERESNKSVQEG